MIIQLQQIYIEQTHTQTSNVIRHSIHIKAATVNGEEENEQTKREWKKNNNKHTRKLENEQTKNQREKEKK